VCLETSLCERMEGCLHMPPTYDTVVCRAQLALVCHLSCCLCLSFILCPAVSVCPSYSVPLSLSVLHTLSHCLSFTVASLFSCYLCRFNPLTPTATIWVQLCTQGWASECPDVKNYKWQHGMLYSCIHMATVVIEWCLRCVGVDSNSVTWVVMSTESVNTWFMINICSIRDGRPSSLTLMTSPGTTQYLVISFCVSSLWTDHYVVP